MTSPSTKKPNPWDDFLHSHSHSPRQGSVGSISSHVHFAVEQPPAGSERPSLQPRADSNGDNEEGRGLRRRRSSISIRINSLANVGGVNSISNFARSWQRAATFLEVGVPRHSVVISDDGECRTERLSVSEYPSPVQHRSLLRQHLEAGVSSSPESAIFDEDDSVDGHDSNAEDGQDTFMLPQASKNAGEERKSDVFAHAPYLASPYAASSQGGVYGSLSSRVNESSMRHAARLFEEQQSEGIQIPDKEVEQLLVKRVEREDGKVVHVVVGRSTLYQTTFNSVNILVGIGLLSLPLGVKYAGWVVGLSFLLFSAIVTRYTAGLLAKCLDVDESLVNFADIAFVSFGPRARIATSILFTIELVGTIVALIVLFADSLDTLVPGWGAIAWKVICGLILIPLSFVPLRLLSFTSVLGIISCLGIVIIVFIDGFTKPHSPGSLREPALTSLWPEKWATLPLSFGLIMSPWGGHSVFPNVYRDMRHPHKYSRALHYTYGFTFPLDAMLAFIGFLMFGNDVHDEITRNLFLTKGYPEALSICIAIFIAVIPLTKAPLNARPIISTIENFAGLDARAIASSPGVVGMSAFSRGILKCIIRILTVVVITLTAILVPDFDRIMAFLGSALCFSICLILPLAFHLKLFNNDLSMKERWLNWFLIVVSSVLAIVGTIWVFIPKAMMGLK